jgi:transketolase
MKKNQISLRDEFGLFLSKIGEKNKKIVAISPDLKQATKLSYFFKKFPKRSIETGIAEANAIGIAAGLALSGFVPVVASFGSFITGKNIEIRTSIAFNNAPVIIVGTHGGLIGADGPTQAGLQDIAVMRSMPLMSVVQPSSAIELRSALKFYIKKKQPVYFRITREYCREFFNKNYVFNEGQISLIIKKTRRILVLTSGPLLQKCFDAIKNIDQKEIGLGNVSSIKPINKKNLKNLVNKTKEIIIFEDHNIHGGMGSAILEKLAEIENKKKVTIYGLNDTFTQSDSPENLYKHYGLDIKSIQQILLKHLKKI